MYKGWMKFNDLNAKIKYIQVTERDNFSKSYAPVWVQFKTYNLSFIFNCFINVALYLKHLMSDFILILLLLLLFFRFFILYMCSFISNSVKMKSSSEKMLIYFGGEQLTWLVSSLAVLEQSSMQAQNHRLSVRNYSNKI